MSRHDRLLHILSLLRTRQRQTVTSLADECGVTTRTIYRDIETLAKANYPIYYDNGYRLLTNAALPPLQFTAEELSVLRAALESWPLASTRAYRTTLRRIAAKIESWQPKATRRKAAVDVRTKTSARFLDPKSLEKIEQAIRTRRSLDIEYDSLTSGMSIRRIDPYFLIFRGRTYYVLAHCHLRGGYRLFRVSRMRQVALSTPFRRDPRLNLDRMFRGSWDVYLGDPFEATVRFHGTAARVIADGEHHPDEEVRQGQDGEIIYRITVSSVEEFGRWLLGFGGEAEVVSPQKLANWVKSQAQAIVACYR